MKKLKIPIIAVFVLLILSSVCLYSQTDSNSDEKIIAEPLLDPNDSVKLEYKFNKGEKIRYKSVIDMNVAVMPNGAVESDIPAISLKIVTYSETTVNNILENGDAEVSTKIESMKMTMMDTTSFLPVEKIPEIKSVMAKNGTIRKCEGLEKIYGMTGGLPLMNSMSSSPAPQHVFPETLLKVGDTWANDIAYGSLIDLHINSKLIEIGAKAGNYDVAVYSDNITGNLHIKSADFKPAGQNENDEAISEDDAANGKFDIRSLTKFSTELGRIISTIGNLDMDINIALQKDNSKSEMNSITLKISGSFENFILSTNEK